jgi:transposase
LIEYEDGEGTSAGGREMRAYSADFRLSVVRAYENGQGSQRQLARLFGVSVSFVQNLLQHYRRTGSITPKPHKGGSRGKIIQYLEVVDRMLEQWPNASLEEMCERLAAEVHVTVSSATMCRALRRLQLRRGRRGSRRRARPPEGQTARYRKTAQPKASEETDGDGSHADVGQAPLPHSVREDLLVTDRLKT